MRNIRVIPILLIKGDGLYKSKQFKNFTYIGDPINAVKIFNEKEVDEICILDIEATANNKPPNIEKIKEIISEAFMPLSYGGGITHVDQVKELMYNGVEKVIINNALYKTPELITEVANIFGSQSVVASIDVKKNIWGKYKVFAKNGKVEIKRELNEIIKEFEERGIGEILINAIDNDGMCSGYNLELIEKVAKNASVPVIAAGGAWTLTHLSEAVHKGASAVAAGSMFVYHGKHKAVLITYPSREEIKAIGA
jgi:imidazole glycerol-phosphate synthase subunit HisF